jgi:hypothetical protein
MTQATLKQLVYLVIVRPAMYPKLIHQIVGLRLAVGFLGEQEQSAWWPSSFLGRHAQTFLNPIFGSNTRMAQYNGVTEAACRVHDERIGVGRVFHLYRLPETIEQWISNAFQEGSLPEDVTRRFDSTEAADSILAGLAKGRAVATPGPVRLGGADMINSRDGVALLAATYRAAFQTGIKCYPYFTDR